MSTWISRAGPAGLVCVALAACLPGGGTSSSRSLAVMGGDVKVVAAQGYCVDRNSSRDSPGQAVVFLGRCTKDAGPVPAIVAVSVGAPGSATGLATEPGALAAYFATDAGRAALSQNGDAASVRLIDVQLADGRIILHLDDVATGEAWRALIGLRGRLVSVSVAAATESAPLGLAGRTLLEQSIAALIRANPGEA